MPLAVVPIDAAPLARLINPLFVFAALALSEAVANMALIDIGAEVPPSAARAVALLNLNLANAPPALDAEIEAVALAASTR